jgi:hypothetical protein
MQMQDELRAPHARHGWLHPGAGVGGVHLLSLPSWTPGARVALTCAPSELGPPRDPHPSPSPGAEICLARRSCRSDPPRAASSSYLGRAAGCGSPPPGPLHVAKGCSCLPSRARFQAYVSGWSASRVLPLSGAISTCASSQMDRSRSSSLAWPACAHAVEGHAALTETCASLSFGAAEGEVCRRSSHDGRSPAVPLRPRLCSSQESNAFVVASHHLGLALHRRESASKRGAFRMRHAGPRRSRRPLRRADAMRDLSFACAFVREGPRVHRSSASGQQSERAGT